MSPTRGSNEQMNALLAEMRCMMRAELEPVQQQIDRMEANVNAREQHGYRVEDSEEEDEPQQRPHFRHGDRHRRQQQYEDNLGNVKVQIPSFQGRSDHEVYLDWETKVDMIFSCHNYSEAKKVKLAAIAFTDHALVWWDELLSERRRYHERPVKTWDDRKAIMRRRYVPNHYYRQLHNKLQRLVQGSKSVDEYYKYMEVAMSRDNVQEDHEVTMARFLNGLNQDIQDVVEMEEYVKLTDMVHKAVKVERQLKCKSLAKRTRNTFTSSSWKTPYKKDVETTSKLKDGSSKEAKHPFVQQQAKEDASMTSRKIKCL